ncbi:hypothetical protein A2154_00550 [Candidatus Gottesmanbacteria bacterium RBG_16_43_7]|uniref:HD domain-containing protein n=1 Tax=Candidatus Gottesmanbacteria bacterium RBG_16_43_7 TaxID=1798373 RepID=A0A1F5Z890_9BACT|nr:MAG: hypothetical protein A2154_00550 [Candidatus Gottesmanbacteria bacterium RBG_16_43_7]
MIPDQVQVQALWQKYKLPLNKQRHSSLVAYTADYIARKIMVSRQGSGVNINRKVLQAAALLHDIDKNIPKLPDEKHPDAGVRILKEEGMAEVAELIKIHPLHMIADPVAAPKSWEEKILFLSDKMVKYDIIGVDDRFRLWFAEQMPQDAREVLDLTYSLVKNLESEICDTIGLTPKELVKNIKSRYTKGANVTLPE